LHEPLLKFNDYEIQPGLSTFLSNGCIYYVQISICYCYRL